VQEDAGRLAVHALSPEGGRQRLGLLDQRSLVRVERLSLVVSQAVGDPSTGTPQAGRWRVALVLLAGIRACVDAVVVGLFGLAEIPLGA
jgi:hypothetical protein